MCSYKITSSYICWAFFAFVLIQTLSQTTAIVGGRDAKPGQFPYMASVMTGDVASCGGVILSRYYILTAAHCVTSSTIKGNKCAPVVVRNNVNVMVGQISREKAMTISKTVRRNPRFSAEDPIKKVAKIIPHPKFGCSNALYSDIAILKLSEGLNFNKGYRSIQLDTNPLPHNVDVTIAGWGRYVLKRKSIGMEQNDLQYMTVKTKRCTENYNREASICMKPTDSHTTGGDSGGPVIYNDKLAGILVTSDSWLMLGLRTHTKEMLQWIKKNAEL